MALFKKPKGGKCSKCGHVGLTFNNDGTGECPNCKRTFTWKKKGDETQQNAGLPSGGKCSKCGHKDLEFNPDGTGKCPECGKSFTWKKAAKKAAPKPAASKEPPQSAKKQVLQKGFSHLIYEEKPDKTFTLFHNLTKENGVPGLIITTVFPTKLQKAYGFEDGMIIRWLTETKVEGTETLVPKRLEFEIARLINRFMHDNNESAILIEGIEYLILENGFDRVIKFLKNMNDTASANNSTIVMPINPRSIDEKELNILKREFDRAG